MTRRLSLHWVPRLNGQSNEVRLNRAEKQGVLEAGERCDSGAKKK